MNTIIVNRYYKLVSPGNSVLNYQSNYVKEQQQSSMARSTVEEE